MIKAEEMTWHFVRVPFPYVWAASRDDATKLVRLWSFLAYGVARRRRPDGSWEYRELSREAEDAIKLDRSI